MTRRLAALGALLALAAPAAPAQESPPAPVGADTTRLRLPDLLAEVGRANPTLQASLLEAGALSQIGAQVGARPDPVASVLVAPFPVVTARGAQRSQWRVEQPLPWPGTLGLRERSADLAAAVAGYEAEALALDLAFEVERAYYDLVHADHVEGVLRTYQARLDAFAEAAAVRYEVGRGPQGAILQVQLEGEQIAERLYRLAAHRTEALQTLARLADRPDLVGSPVAVAPPALPDSLDALLARALRERPEVRALETARERARTEVALAEKAFYPDLSVGVTYTDIADRELPATADGRDALAFTVSARIPLARGRLRARLEETRLREAQVAAREAALQTQVETQVTTLAERARQARETLRLFEDRLRPLATSTVETTLASYTTGETDYLAFLDAERTRFGVQLAAVDARHHVLVAVAALRRALGLSAPDGEAPALHSTHGATVHAGPDATSPSAPHDR